MAYNKRNKLLRIIEVQNIVLEHKNKGVTQQRIYESIIYPRFGISRCTFYNYLATNARKELKEIADKIPA